MYKSRNRHLSKEDIQMANKLIIERCSISTVTGEVTIKTIVSCHFAVAQLLLYVWLSVNPWLAEHQAPLSSTISQNLFKFMSTELVMLSYHLILYCHLFPLPSILPVSGISKHIHYNSQIPKLLIWTACKDVISHWTLTFIVNRISKWYIHCKWLLETLFIKIKPCLTIWSSNHITRYFIQMT